MTLNIITNKNNGNKIFMDSNEYQQMLIKCGFIETVCDTLMKELQNTILSKAFFRNKIISQAEFCQAGRKEEKRENWLKDDDQSGQRKDIQVRFERIELEIKESQSQVKRLKYQISQLKESRHEGVKNTRLATRRIKETAQLQFESLQLRKLLNFELQNLNSIESSNIEVREAIQAYEKKQIQVKNKISSQMEKEKQHFKCRQMEEQYESLLLEKRKMVQQNSLFDHNSHTKLFNKINAISQAKSNLEEMNNYEKQLKCLIKEQQFIIEQIQSREIVNQNKPTKIQVNLEEEDDNELFQKEINNLRKTIANRKFKEKSKNIKTENKLEAFQNNPTPKNSIHYSRGESQGQKKNKQTSKDKNQSSIFKIEIGPVSHLQPIRINNKEENIREHRNSLPAKVNKQDLLKSPLRKPSQVTKAFLSDNKLPDLDSIQLEALQKIIKQKESQMQYAFNSPKAEQSYHNAFIDKKNGNLVRNIAQTKKILYTEPIEVARRQKSFSKKEDLKISPNSRFIEQLIESNDSIHLQKLKSNVRIRTKKSQSEKYKHMHPRTNFNVSKRNKTKQQSQQSKLSQSNTMNSFLAQSIQIQEKNAKTTNNLSQKMNESISNNEFLGVNLQRQNSSEQKHYKPKYKDKIQLQTYEKSSLENVFEKIDLLKKAKLQNLNKEGSTQRTVKTEISVQKSRQGKEKVKVFKLSNKRKYGNVVIFDRKGKSEGIEESESEQDVQLPKIQEEDESIRNTIQSIAAKQNQG